MKAAMDKLGNGFERWLALLALALFVPVQTVRAGDGFAALLAQGDLAVARGDVAGAQKFYDAADRLDSTNGPELCHLTKGCCDLMHLIASPALQESLARIALTNAFRAEQADPQSPTAHLCVAVCYVKNFPYAGNATKVRWSKAIKTECETAIALDPRQDVAYYLLGRWYFGVANMNFLLKGLVDIVYGALPRATNEDAVRNFQKAIALAPNRIIDHFELARAWAVMGESDRARSELEKCRALKPVDRDDADAQADALKLLASRP